MPATNNEIQEQIHRYWFGPLDEAGMAAPERHQLWFASTPENDRQCQQQFGQWVERALTGELDSWTETDRGLIALILLLDQFTRTIYRGTPRAFAGDERALRLAQYTIEHGHHLRLPAIHQVFLYLPLEHSEDLDTQNESVELFQALSEITGLKPMQEFTRYAIAHRDVIAQFGRFPHRNSILERHSSRKEEQHLRNHGGF